MQQASLGGVRVTGLKNVSCKRAIHGLVYLMLRSSRDSDVAK